MRSAGYQSSFTSQLCNYGSNEIQMPLPAFSDISLNLCGGSSLFSESHVNSDHQHFGSFVPLSSMECPESFDSFHVPAGWLTNTTTASSMAPSGPILSDTTAVEKENARKRKFEYESREGKKKNKSICLEDRRLCLPYKEQSPTGTEAKKGPVKRSQKISDKITVLQKLVSPFGKTDTASVLQEAHSYIKYLQEQIEIFAAPYFLRPLHSQGVGRSVDLHSRGLSLVPVSVTKSLSKDNQIAHCAARRPSFNMKF